MATINPERTGLPTETFTQSKKRTRRTDRIARDSHPGIMAPAGASLAMMGPKKYVTPRKEGWAENGGEGPQVAGCC